MATIGWAAFGLGGEEKSHSRPTLRPWRGGEPRAQLGRFRRRAGLLRRGKGLLGRIARSARWAEETRSARRAFGPNSEWIFVFVLSFQKRN